MDVRRYRFPVPRKVRCPSGISLTIRPLAISEIDEAKQRAIVHFACHNIEASEDIADIENMVQVISVSTNVHAAKIRSLDIREILFFSKKWGEIQRDSIPDFDELKNAIDIAIHDEKDLIIDAAAAYHSQSPVEFYGVSATRLTVGQLLFFILLKNAFQKYYASDNKTMVSKKCLDQKLNKRKQGKGHAK